MKKYYKKYVAIHCLVSLKNFWIPRNICLNCALRRNEKPVLPYSKEQTLLFFDIFLPKMCTKNKLLLTLRTYKHYTKLQNKCSRNLRVICFNQRNLFFSTILCVRMDKLDSRQRQTYPFYVNTLYISLSVTRAMA